MQAYSSPGGGQRRLGPPRRAECVWPSDENHQKNAAATRSSSSTARLYRLPPTMPRWPTYRSLISLRHERSLESFSAIDPRHDGERYTRRSTTLAGVFDGADRNLGGRWKRCH